MLERDERHPARAQHAADDLADATEAGDHDARRVIVRQFVVRFLVSVLESFRDALGDRDQERRRRPRQHDHRRQQVAQIAGEYADTEREPEQHEREFAALRNHCGHAQRIRHRHLRGVACDQVQHGRLDQQQQRNAGEHRGQRHQHQRPVDAHADRQEEQSEQQTLERFQVRFDFVAILGVGEQDAAEECTERHRQAGEPGDPCGAQRDRQGRCTEGFDAARRRGDAEQGSHQVAPGDHHRSDAAECLGQADQREAVAGDRRAEQRNQGQCRDRGQVLEQQDAECVASARARQRLAFGHQLHADRGRAERQCAADHHRYLPVVAERQREQREQHRGRDELQQAKAKYCAPHQP